MATDGLPAKNERLLKKKLVDLRYEYMKRDIEFHGYVAEKAKFLPAPPNFYPANHSRDWKLFRGVYAWKEINREVIQELPKPKFVILFELMWNKVAFADLPAAKKLQQKALKEGKEPPSSGFWRPFIALDSWVSAQTNTCVWPKTLTCPGKPDVENTFLFDFDDAEVYLMANAFPSYKGKKWGESVIGKVPECGIGEFGTLKEAQEAMTAIDSRGILTDFDIIQQVREEQLSKREKRGTHSKSTHGCSDIYEFDDGDKENEEEDGDVDEDNVEGEEDDSNRGDEDYEYMGTNTGTALNGSPGVVLGAAVTNRAIKQARMVDEAAAAFNNLMRKYKEMSVDDPKKERVEAELRKLAIKGKVQCEDLTMNLPIRRLHKSIETQDEGGKHIPDYAGRKSFLRERIKQCTERRPIPDAFEHYGKADAGSSSAQDEDGEDTGSGSHGSPGIHQQGSISTCSIKLPPKPLNPVVQPKNGPGNVVGSGQRKPPELRPLSVDLRNGEGQLEMEKSDSCMRSTTPSGASPLWHTDRLAEIDLQDEVHGVVNDLGEPLSPIAPSAALINPDQLPGDINVIRSVGGKTSGLVGSGPLMKSTEDTLLLLRNVVLSLEDATLRCGELATADSNEELNSSSRRKEDRDHGILEALANGMKALVLSNGHIIEQQASYNTSLKELLMTNVSKTAVFCGPPTSASTAIPSRENGSIGKIMQQDLLQRTVHCPDWRPIYLGKDPSKLVDLFTLKRVVEAMLHPFVLPLKSEDGMNATEQILRTKPRANEVYRAWSMKKMRSTYGITCDSKRVVVEDKNTRQRAVREFMTEVMDKGFTANTVVAHESRKQDLPQGIVAFLKVTEEDVRLSQLMDEKGDLEKVVTFFLELKKIAEEIMDLERNKLKLSSFKLLLLNPLKAFLEDVTLGTHSGRCSYNDRGECTKALAVQKNPKRANAKQLNCCKTANDQDELDSDEEEANHEKNPSGHDNEITSSSSDDSSDENGPEDDLEAEEPVVIGEDFFNDGDEDDVSAEEGEIESGGEGDSTPVRSGSKRKRVTKVKGKSIKRVFACHVGRQYLANHALSRQRAAAKMALRRAKSEQLKLRGRVWNTFINCRSYRQQRGEIPADDDDDDGQSNQASSDPPLQNKALLYIIDKCPKSVMFRFANEAGPIKDTLEFCFTEAMRKMAKEKRKSGTPRQKAFRQSNKAVTKTPANNTTKGTKNTVDKVQETPTTADGSSNRASKQGKRNRKKSTKKLITQAPEAEDMQQQRGTTNFPDSPNLAGVNFNSAGTRSTAVQIHHSGQGHHFPLQQTHQVQEPYFEGPSFSDLDSLAGGGPPPLMPVHFANDGSSYTTMTRLSVDKF